MKDNVITFPGPRKDILPPKRARKKLTPEEPKCRYTVEVEHFAGHLHFSIHSIADDMKSKHAVAVALEAIASQLRA